VSVPEHGTIREDIPAYVASRLEGEALRRFEAHLQRCEDCTEMVATWKQIAAAVPEGGEALFEPHPDVASLRKYARGEETADPRRLARHLASCSTCELEVTAWKVRDAGLEGVSPGVVRRVEGASRRPGRRIGARLLALVAGLAAGAAAVLLLRPPLPPIQITERPAPASPAPSGFSGPVALNVLPTPLRGSNDIPTVKVREAQSPVLIAIQPVLPDRVDDSASYRAVIRDAHGEDAWASGITAGEIRGHLLSAGVVTLAVPASDLPAGEYEILVLPKGAGSDQAILLIPFKVER
jgi:hypothetical protein